jgi:PIN domain
MRFIFIDSNIFFDNWQLNSASFQRLANFLAKSDASLVIPEVVCLEVQNLYKRENATLLQMLKKTHDKLQKQLSKAATYDESQYVEEYNFRQLLTNTYRYVTILPFDKIAHSTMVERAISVKMPFKDSEKGYRDSLIWLSILGWLKDKTPNDHLFFITNNKTDFYAGDLIELHKDLLSDLLDNGIETEIIPFLSLPDFLNEIDSDEESLLSPNTIREKYLKKTDLEIEEWLQDEINSITPPTFKGRIDPTGAFRHLRNVSYFEFEIVEGIEDPEVMSYKRISDRNLYILFAFQLRTCELTATVPAEDYFARKFGFDSYAEAAVDGDQSYLRIYFRPIVTISMIVDMETNELSGLELVAFEVKKLHK